MPDAPDRPAAPVRRASRARRSDIVAPPEFAGDLLVWAAWLYYEEQLTQEEVAERLGVSRATVINLLNEARLTGVVSIAIVPSYFQSVTLARQLAERFGLESCMVVPAGDPAMPTYERIGRAGARLLSQRLQPGDVLGVSWGRTVLALSNALPPAAMPQVSVAQITGSAISTEDFSPEFCTSNIAAKIGARCVNLHAPGIVSRSEVRDILLAEPALAAHFGLIRGCNKILFGIAGLGEESVAISSGYLSQASTRSYRERGAVGVLAGRLLDREGRPVLGELDDRMIGLTLEEIRTIPERLCVAGGAEKVEAIRAMLLGGYATALITDETAAAGLMAAEPPSP